ncbi:tetratricopeptide repeat protein [Schlesneria sp.]|uniref:tetratricopeptide repeat protein n=1 Tax=Schlesneria sp. TaxID=2762018 RepID=UPI002F1B39CC
MKHTAGVRNRRSIWVMLIILLVVPLAYWGHQVWQAKTVKSLASLCYEASRNSQWDKLAKASERWSYLEPQRAEPWLFRAEAAEEVQDWKLMAKCLGSIPRTDRRAIPSLARKAGLEFEYLNRPWDGLKTCDEIISLDPRVLLAHKQSIFFAAMTLQRAELVKRIRAAIRVRRESPEAYVYLASASWFYGASLYRNNSFWLEGNPDDETFQVARAMQIYMSEAKSNLEEAENYAHIPEATELLQRYPHNLELLAYFINLAIEDGNIDEVSRLLASVPQEAADGDARIWRARAWKADVENDFESALELALRAYAIDPYWWKVHFQIHDICRRLGKAEESQRFFKLYEVSVPLSKMIMEMNRSSEAFDDFQFRTSLMTLAELIEDAEVVTALRSRITGPQQ